MPAFSGLCAPVLDLRNLRSDAGKRKVLGDKRYIPPSRTLSRDTMKVHWIAILIVLGAALFAPAVSAKIIEEKDGYVVSTIDEDTRFADFARLSVSPIIQGQRDYYSTYVPSGKTSFSHFLSWGSVANSLALTIETPAGILGTYYDSSDGSTDGRISLKISRAGGLASGTWPSSVYGHRVSGTETYSYQTALS